jgi:hypothetical protein
MWGAYMPLGASLALLAGPHRHCMERAAMGLAHPVVAAGRAGRSAGLACCMACAGAAARCRGRASSGQLIGGTLRSRAAWLMAMAFAMYSGQWLAVVGFLPSIYAQAGLAGATGPARSRRLPPPSTSSATSPPGACWGAACRRWPCSVRAFWRWRAVPCWLFRRVPPTLQYVAILCFSMVGGLIPGYPVQPGCPAGAQCGYGVHHGGLDAAMVGAGPVRGSSAGGLGGRDSREAGNGRAGSPRPARRLASCWRCSCSVCRLRART